MHIQVLLVFKDILRKDSDEMSKVVFKSPYAPSGKSVGGGYINYMAKRERVDKSINTKKIEINLNYIATRPRVEKIGEHGLFGSEDDVNLKYYSKHSEKSFDALEKNKNFGKRLQNVVLKTALKDNRQGNVHTNKIDASPVFGNIVFNLCKIFEQSIQKDIEEGFTKTIVDSKERAKEYRRDHGMGMHM